LTRVPLQLPNARFRSAVRGFYLWLGSLVCAAVGPLVARQLIHSHTLAGRAGGVLVGTVAWVPLVILITIIIRDSDEFVRRIHLVSLALAFASALMLLSLLGWLVDAHFMKEPGLEVLWLAFAVFWAIWLLVVKYRFERRG
jgi:hypothetical protein